MYWNFGPVKRRFRCKTETLASMILGPRMPISEEERGQWVNIIEVQPRAFRTFWGLQNPG